MLRMVNPPNRPGTPQGAQAGIDLSHATPIAAYERIISTPRPLPRTVAQRSSRNGLPEYCRKRANDREPVYTDFGTHGPQAVNVPIEHRSGAFQAL